VNWSAPTAIELVYSLWLLPQCLPHLNRVALLRCLVDSAYTPTPLCKRQHLFQNMSGLVIGDTPRVVHKSEADSITSPPTDKY
jgi:hypothetical protein